MNSTLRKRIAAVAVLLAICFSATVSYVYSIEDRFLSAGVSADDDERFNPIGRSPLALEVEVTQRPESRPHDDGALEAYPDIPSNDLLSNQSSLQSLATIDAIHVKHAAYLLSAVDSESFLWQCGQQHDTFGAPSVLGRCDDAATAASRGSRDASGKPNQLVPPLYPPSVEAYTHPFGTCRDKQRRVPIDKYSATFAFGHNDPAADNFTRFWPHLPDARDVPRLLSEHERCHYVMARMLAIVATILRQYNMSGWFVTHATLLGAVRHGGFIPWDADIDIAMPRSHLIFLRKRWRREFPRDMFLQTEKTDSAFHMWNGKERAVRIKDRYSNFPGMRFSVQKGSKRFRQKKYHLGAHVDVIPLEKRSGRIKILHSYFEAKDVYPLTTVCFENMDLPAPRNATAFLSAIYGNDFMTPPKNASFGGPTVLPCMATQRMKGNPWSLSWANDHHLVSRNSSDLKTEVIRWPREDPDHGTYLSDYKMPHRLYYNSRW